MNLNDARKIIDAYISAYNNTRLHSSIYYLPPKDVMMGKTKEKLKQRDAKLKRARELRKRMELESKTG